MDTKTIYIKGVLKSSYNHQEKDDNGNVTGSNNVITVFADGVTISDENKKELKDFFQEFYKGKPAKWVPNWYKDNKDFIALKSTYNVPVKTEFDGHQMSFAQWVERGNIRGASVTVKCNVKESAVYPNAMLVHADGEPYDAFAEF